MSQHEESPTFFNKRNIVASALTLSIGIGCYQLSSNSDSNEVSPVPTLEPKSTAQQVNQLEPVAITNEVNDKAHPTQHTHGVGCGCVAHDETTVGSTKKAVPAIPLTQELRQQLLNHSKGEAISFTLPGGILASGTVEVTQRDNGKIIALSGKLTAPLEGDFYFHEEQLEGGVAGAFSGAAYFTESDVAYLVKPSEDGSPELQETHADNVLCRNYSTPLAAAPAEEGTISEIAPDHPTNINVPSYQNGVPPLSNRPTATAVVYLDFDGEQGPFISWGDFDAAHSGFNNTQIREIWERVAEDFAPFNINVTTDLQKYLDAPANGRIHCIITTTTSAAPGTGGVAFVGEFNRALDRPCWAFSSSIVYTANTISHEIGHTMYLGHDGRNANGEIYYAGHGSGDVSWGPIMGANSRNLTQWSKGEYLDANNTQDDLAIIEGNIHVSYRQDDHGDTLASASHLEIQSDGSVDSEGNIETSADVDSFKFTITSSNSQVTLNIDPVTDGPNLDILAVLSDSSGTVITSSNPDTALDATISQQLGVGEYTLNVSGVGRGSATGDGYTDYATLGEYKITGSVANAIFPDRFTIAENSANGTTVGTVTANNNHGGDSLTYAISSGDSSGALSIDSNGTLTVADTAQFNFETLSSYFDDPATFDLEVTITNLTTPALTETVRVVVTVSDVNEAPVITAPNSINVLEHLEIGTKILTVTQTDEDIYDLTQTWAITSGNTGGAFSIDATTGVISVAAPLLHSSLSSYTLELTSTDSGSLQSSVNLVVNIVEVTGSHTPGSIHYTRYNNISGNALSNLTSSSKFPHSPDSLTDLTSTQSSNNGDSYGSVMRGFVIPPTTGNYTFWVAADDQAEIHLSTDDDPANTSVIANLSGASGANNWSQNPSQESSPIALTAGQPYYIEIRHKEGTGGDHISAAWQGPDLAQQVIQGQHLAPYDLNYAPILQNATLTLQDDIYNGHSVTTASFTDFNSGDSLSNFMIIAGNSDGTFTIDSATGDISIADNSNIVAGNSYNLTVQASDSGTPTATGSGTLTFQIKSPNELREGHIHQQIFSDISGSLISSLTSNSNYPQSPSSTRTLTSFDSGQNIGELYGSRVRALIVPPTTGNYRLYISSDDSSELYLSSDDTAANKTLEASVTGATYYNAWTDLSSQKSSIVSLTAGQKYYIETLHAEGSGGDHLQVAWTGPGFASPTIIAGTYLERYTGEAPAWDAAPYTFSADNTDPNGTAVGTVSATDNSSDTLVYNIISGNENGEFAIAPLTGVISIANRLALPTGSIVLGVGVQDEADIFNETLTNVTISVTGNNAPVVNTASFNIAENSASASPVGTVTFTDPDTETWVYSFDSGNENGHFAIDPSTGAITSTSVILDFEEQNTHNLVVRVTDSSGYYGAATITVNVTDIAADDSDADGLDDAWELAHFGNTSTTSGNSDPDGDGLTNLEEIAAGTTATASDSDLDGFNDGFEINQGTDPLSNSSTPVTILAAYWDFNDALTASNAYDRVASHSGAITSGAAYTADQGGRTGSAGDHSMDFGAGNNELVDVTNVAFLNNATADDKLTISFWQKLDSIKSSNSFYATSPTGSSNNRGIQAHSPWTDQSIYFDMGGAGSGQRSTANGSSVDWTSWLHITLVKDGSTAEIWVNGTKLQTSTAMNPLLTDMTRLTIGGGSSGLSINGVIDDFAIFNTALTPGQIALLNSGDSPLSLTKNQLPVANDATFTVAENSANGTAVGTVTVNDPGDTLTFAITAGNAGNAFAIDNSGNITVDQVVDYELYPSHAYVLSLLVTDSVGDTDTATITVNVTDGIDAPTITDSSANVAENASIGTVVTTVSVIDPDLGDTHSFAIISGNENGDFDIDANGQITTLTSLDFETTRQHLLVVEATDSGALTGTATITVNVTNVVEGINLALSQNHTQAAGATASQSTTAGGASASRAIDGNTDGLYSNGSVTHTDSAATGAVWWQVDLGQSQAIHTVQLFNRASIQTRLSNFTVSILDSSSSVVTSQNFYEGSGNAGTTETWTLPSTVTGQFVRVELIGGLNNDGNKVLSLAEVQVMGGGTASQSTTGSGGIASRAIDNNTNGLWSGNSVTHTDSSSANWWEVELAQASIIEQVDLFNRTDAGLGDRLSNFRVTLWLEGTQVYSSDHFTQSGTFAGASYSIADLNGLTADTVRIESLGLNADGNRVISLAEVQVHGMVAPPVDPDSDSDQLDDSWETTHYGNLTTITSTDDTDGDGYNSFKEMAFGMNPTTRSQLSDHMTSTIVDDNGVDMLELSFRRPINHAALGIVYQLKSSTTLSSWGNDSTIATSTTPDADGITEWVSFRFDPDDAAAKFIQLEATPAP